MSVGPRAPEPLARRHLVSVEVPRQHLRALAGCDKEKQRYIRLLADNTIDENRTWAFHCSFILVV